MTTDIDQGDLLTLLADDPSPLNVDHVTAITAAILVVGETTPGGAISPNAVRSLLRRTHGFLPSPQRIGPTYRRLVAAGLIRRDGYEVSDDTEGRNSGRMVPTYRLVPTCVPYPPDDYIPWDDTDPHAFDEDGA